MAAQLCTCVFDGNMPLMRRVDYGGRARGRGRL